MPCGEWTVQAIITDGQVASGVLDEGIARFRVYEIGLLAGVIR
jgi:hypothetical protein